MTDPLSRLVARAQADRAERTGEDLAASDERVSAHVAMQLQQMLQRRAEAGELVASIEGISADDLGTMSCMVDGLTTAEASEQLGISAAKYDLARQRITAAINRHNQFVRMRGRARQASA